VNEDTATQTSTYRNHPINDYRSVLPADGQLIDVREAAEVRSGSLPGAVNIPVGQLVGRVHELDRTRPVALFCRSGARSAAAAEYLAANGFSTVVNLAGGMLAYSQSQ